MLNYFLAFSFFFFQASKGITLSLLLQFSCIIVKLFLFSSSSISLFCFSFLASSSFFALHRAKLRWRASSLYIIKSTVNDLHHQKNYRVIRDKRPGAAVGKNIEAGVMGALSGSVKNRTQCHKQLATDAFNAMFFGILLPKRLAAWISPATRYTLRLAAANI